MITIYQTRPFTLVALLAGKCNKFAEGLPRPPVSLSKNMAVGRGFEPLVIVLETIGFPLTEPTVGDPYGI